MSRNDNVDIPSLTLDQDEVSERRTANSQIKRKLNPPPARPVNAEGVTYKKTSLGGVYFLLLLILGGAGGAGYWLWQQNQMLLGELQLTKSEVKNLDHQLLAADVSANEQGSTLEETLKIHSSEIRKLWGVAYDTNRKAITSNKTSVETINEALSSLKETASTQAKLIAVQGNAFNDIEAGYNQLIEAMAALENVKIEQEGVLTELRLNQDQLQKASASLEEKDLSLQGRLEANSIQLTSYDAEIASLKAQLTTLSKTIKTLTGDMDSLGVTVSAISNRQSAGVSSVPVDIERTLKDHQEAIDSVDAFRAQMNDAINRLESQVLQMQLQQQLSTEAP
ncbi:hypothetical protein [Marinomonas sp. 2405UD68-3]|uniref:hypothetical protein n=1 Tax=Marinomonas sp. 2405UD68-3 TaxID=3391835 RepID=UPI0039C95742